MIRNQWYVILESDEVKPGRPVGVTRLGEKLVLWRDSAGKVVCMHDVCPHLGALLSQGKSNGKTLACPFHGFEYDSSGACQYVPSLGAQGNIPKALRVNTYPAYEAHHLIWIYWGIPPADLKLPRFFDNIDEQSCSYMSFQQHWGVHYSRMVENQLDVMHLPFVHHNTIGRGGRMVVDGPLVTLDDDLIRVWVYNRLDDGTPARKMEELSAPSRHAALEFIFPNLWHNWISDDIHITAAFVPVDEENGIFYGRYYQRVVRIPVLRSLVNLVGVWGSILIANQDHRVVTHQVPKKTELKRMGEKMLQGDRGILTYRMHRHQLKIASGQIEE
jgi:phenylpropionate dioxygenase-like ring-hydroxylating dioxygenase large terminal subunit